jgi:hypothetical protein
MRATNLVKVAAQAKIFRIQHMLKRQGVRAAFGLAVNLLIAMIFGLLAARSSPSRQEREAVEVTQRALREARSSLALGAVIHVAGALWRSRRRDDIGRRPFVPARAFPDEGGQVLHHVS